MNKEISKNLKCICLKNGVEIWVEEDRIQSLIDNLNALSGDKFIKIGNEIVRSSEIVGIFSAQTMETKERRRMGQWMCKYGYWHDKGEKCAHGELEKLEKMYPTYSEK
ncbi:MAG: hypothetical protein ABIM54_00985 [candidate division WOR-3 bacterium]